MAEVPYPWIIIHHLDKGSLPYFPFETGTLSVSIENTGEVRYHIYNFGIKFDWHKEGEWWVRSCSVELDPGEKESLPPLSFRIPVDVKLKTHTYKVGVAQEVLIDSKWKDLGARMSKQTFHVLVEESPSRDFKVFISHSNEQEDKPLVDTIQKLLGACGINAYIAEKKAEPGIRLWSKLEREIRTSDAMLVLFTKHGATSGDVREEIGIAVGARKYEKIVPIAELDLEGSLKGKEYAPLDIDNPQIAIVQAIETIVKMAMKKRPAPSREVKAT